MEGRKKGRKEGRKSLESNCRPFVLKACALTGLSLLEKANAEVDVILTYNCLTRAYRRLCKFQVTHKLL